MKLTLVRHTAPDVSKGVFYGKTDVDLKPTFEIEAETVKSNLKEKSFDKVFSSPRSRCLRLAKYCGFPDPVISEDVAEMDFGNWEMMHFNDITDDSLYEYFEDWKNTIPPGGESFVQHGERVKRFINSCLEQDLDSILVFTHGGTILHAMILLGVIDDSRPFDHTPDYCSIIELEINNFLS